MKFIFLCALALLIFKPNFLLTKATNSAHVFQHLCYSGVEKLYGNSDTRNSILCGKKITDVTLLKNLVHCGLIHLFVISGGHLQFILAVLKKTKCPTWLIHSGLVLFSLFTGFQAPLVRITIQHFTNSYLKKRNILLRPDLQIFIGSAVTLLLFPNWISSWSFHLSWMASLALAVPLPKDYPWVLKIFCQQLAMTLFLTPALLQFTDISIHSWLYNIVSTPILSPALIPLALSPFWEPFIQKLTLVLQSLHIENSLTQFPKFQISLIATSLTLHLFVATYRQHFWRSRVHGI